MPYYITLQFDPAKEEYDEGKLVERFLKAGVSFKESPDYEGGRGYFYGYHLIFFGRHIQKAHEKGMWVSVHISWGSEPEELITELTKILDLADKLGCKVYDGQLDMYITRENLDKIAIGFAKMAGKVIGYFGTVDKERHQAELEKTKK